MASMPCGWPGLNFQKWASVHPPALLFGVDSGASGTRLITDAAADATVITLPSLNPAAIDAPQDSWRELCAAIAARADGPVRGCIATASMSVATGNCVANALKEAAREQALVGTVFLINDAAALLLGPPLLGTVGIVVSVGTGAAFWARDSAGVSYSAGGYEFIMSDEGGGFDIGQRGLQAAAQAYDGRGPRTGLLSALEQRYGFDVPTLGRRLAVSREPKSEVARFAVDVCSFAPHDPVAADIMTNACSSIMRGVAAMVCRVDQNQQVRLVCAGGLISGSSLYASMLRAAIAESWPAITVHEVHDTARVALRIAEDIDLASRLAGPPIETRVVLLP